MSEPNRNNDDALKAFDRRQSLDVHALAAANLALSDRNLHTGGERNIDNNGTIPGGVDDISERTTRDAGEEEDRKNIDALKAFDRRQSQTGLALLAANLALSDRLLSVDNDESENCNNGTTGAAGDDEDNGNGSGSGNGNNRGPHVPIALPYSNSAVISSGLLDQPQPQSQSSPKPKVVSTDSLAPGAHRDAPGVTGPRVSFLRYSNVGREAPEGEDSTLIQVPKDVKDDIRQSATEKCSSPFDTTNRSSDLLLRAVPVDDDALSLGVASPVSPEEIEAFERRQSRNRRGSRNDIPDVNNNESCCGKLSRAGAPKVLVIFGCVAAILLLGGILGLALGLRSTNAENRSSISSASPSLAASRAPSVAPSSILDSLLEQLPMATVNDILTDVDSPQWKAYDWLSNHENVTRLEQWR